MIVHENNKTFAAGRALMEQLRPFSPSRRISPSQVRPSERETVGIVIDNLRYRYARTFTTMNRHDDAGRVAAVRYETRKSRVVREKKKTREDEGQKNGGSSFGLALVLDSN